jgi:peptidoglycan-associated lipoprotein
MKGFGKFLLFMAAASFLAAACAPKKSLRAGKKPGASGLDAEAESSAGSSLPETDVDEALIRGREFRPAGELKAVPFDFDSYELNEEARSVLKGNADYLKSHAGLEVLIEGHCDERGTREYNLALGQKRAKEARDYLIRLGVQGRRTATISYGQERPVCSDSTEECWAKNRRGETKVRSRTAANASLAGE